MIKRPSLSVRRCAWWALQLVYALCMLGLVLLPAHRYDWMRELDPGFDGPLPVDDSGDRRVAIAVLLAGAVTAQVLCLAWLARTPRQRLITLALGGVAICLTLWRFGWN